MLLGILTIPSFIKANSFHVLLLVIKSFTHLGFLIKLNRCTLFGRTPSTKDISPKRLVKNWNFLLFCDLLISTLFLSLSLKLLRTGSLISTLLPDSSHFPLFAPFSCPSLFTIHYSAVIILLPPFIFADVAVLPLFNIDKRKTFGNPAWYHFCSFKKPLTPPPPLRFEHLVATFLTDFVKFAKMKLSFEHGFDSPPHPEWC